MKRISIFTILLICFACKADKNTKPLPDNYHAEFEDYKDYISKDRLKLFKLSNDANTFGKNTVNNFVIPIESLPETIGSFNNTKDSIIFEASKGIIIKTALDSTITKMKMSLDAYGNSEKLFHDRLNWQLITRANAPYLRVWDSKNPDVDVFKGFELFDLNSEFIFEAQFTYFDTKKIEDVKSKLGVNASTQFIGQVTFNYQDQSYTLDVGNDGFTMVSDATTSESTYGGGRYVYLELPEKNGAVTVDFNRLYNPPCSFSKYTTCLYPPRQNILPFDLLAGETLKRY